MIKRMSFKQLLFILPLLIIVTVFSIYPIISSFIYTAFDYRINDQQYSKLYLTGSFNAELFYQTGGYVAFYLNDELYAAPDQGAADEIAALIEDISGFITPYENEVGSRKIGGAEAGGIDAFISGTESRLNALYEGAPDADFYHREDMPILIGEMRSCFIAPNFVGLANYGKLLGDTRFWSALSITLVFTFISVFIELILGMALALIMDKALKAIGLIRTTTLVPWAIPTAVSALIWSYLYDGSNGIVSKLFAACGLIASPQSMLLSAGGALASSVLADVWKTTPYMALLLLAGLQIIDRGLYESASIDGADTVKRFVKITLPLMKPSILVALLFRMLDAFRVYDLIAVLTGGGPGGATETLSIYAYKLMVSRSDYGYGSVVVAAMFACVALIAFFFVKVMGAELMGNADD